MHTDDEWDAVVGHEEIVRPGAERLAARPGWASGASPSPLSGGVGGGLRGR
ncbi:hypothetical protein [Streptomyces sp.]